MLAIVGGKGGCGKTTTALGIARALSTGGGRPVVVDADCSMPNLHTRADTDRRPGVGAVADGAAPERVCHRSRAYPGVDILPAGSATGRPAESTLRRLRRVDGPVVLDCPAGATNAVTTPLAAGDSALVVSTAERASLSDAAKTARMAHALDTPVVGAVVTRTRRPDLPDCPALDELRAHCPVVGTVPEVDGHDVLASRAGRAAYGSLADGLDERNI
jgi:septum site-determining protein MinD